ncbi:MAG: hypothetical protein KDB22_21665 [Planctomycetales bacterium]|nr:hypothetical protein [Planctomycetales bacterium]
MDSNIRLQLRIWLLCLACLSCVVVSPIAGGLLSAEAVFNELDKADEAESDCKEVLVFRTRLRRNLSDLSTARAVETVVVFSTSSGTSWRTLSLPRGANPNIHLRI